MVLFACNTASNSYYDNHFKFKVITVEQTIAQKISEFLFSKNENSIVIGGDGYGVFSGWSSKFQGFRQSESKENTNTENGGFITIKNGVKQNKRKYAYTGWWGGTSKGKKSKPVE